MNDRTDYDCELQYFDYVEMPCTQCMAPYTAFRKEQGCSNCGFGFCSNCLNHKVIIRRLANKPVSVCPPCYRKLTQGNNEMARYDPPESGGVRLGERWWGEDELPPPSMRHTYSTSRHPFRTKLPHRVSPQPPPYSALCGNNDDRDIEKRLDNLKSERRILENKESKRTPTLSEIEERLAKLREVSVEEIRNPSLMFARKKGEVKEETMKDIIEKACDEVRIEKKWDPVKQLEQRYNQYHHIEVNNDHQEELPTVEAKKFCGESPTSSTINSDIIMSEETIRGMKDLADKLKFAEQESCEAAACVAANDRSTKKEIRRIARLTRQESLKNEKINKELGEFWERNLERYGNRIGSDEDNEVDEAELQKIIREAEEAENEVKETMKKSKKVRNKGGFLSKFFRSAKD
uniref:FYVE-type domain-containing protein n=2 Tax=Parascaris univalens TaxID=6257 RepID=A0A915C2H4_PARUN